MTRQPLRVVTFLAPNMLPVYDFVIRTLSARLGVAMELVTGSTYDDVARADLSFICGLPYVLRTHPRISPSAIEALAAPVLQGERYGGKPVYFSDVIVHRDSPYRSFADLRGCRWAYNEPESQSGYGITRYSLVKMGETGSYFGAVVAAGFHQKAIRMVCADKVDAAAIDSQVLAVELRDHPRLAAQLRVIDALGPSTIQPLAAACHLPETLKADIRAALSDMHRDAGARAHLARGFIDRFVAVADSDYDDIRAMLSACEAAGYLTLR